MYQKVLQCVSNCTLVQLRFGTPLSVRRKFAFLRLLFVVTPSYAVHRRILNFDLLLPNVSLKRDYLYDFRLYGQLVVSCQGLAKMLAPLAGEHTSGCSDLKQFAYIRLCVAKQLIAKFFQFVYGKLNFVAEYRTNSNVLRHNCLPSISRLCQGLTSKFPAFCSP